jgi:hypothetical protein
MKRMKFDKNRPNITSGFANQTCLNVIYFETKTRHPESRNAENGIHIR